MSLPEFIDALRKVEDENAHLRSLLDAWRPVVRAALLVRRLPGLDSTQTYPLDDAVDALTDAQREEAGMCEREEAGR